jgi:hypothetical protein
MPARIVTPEEFEKSTGLPRVRYIIELPPARLKPPQKRETPPTQSGPTPTRNGDRDAEQS